ncbi:Fe-S protein assembly chaperone HscA [Buchnera aphidicola]|uniref:Fe-S protein assembly chaperone HscA n=1 Tax=Buchnera aphidicola TaxID=9 RepID=UPI003463E729
MIVIKNKEDTKLTIGIDLGTTYSLVATINQRCSALLLDHNKNFLLPSIVHYQKNNVLVGFEAKKKIIEDPINTISSVKRLMGRSIDFVQKNFPVLPYIIKENYNGGIEFHTNFGIVTPIDVSSEILKYLKKKIYSLFHQNIYASIITVPAYFNNLQKIATKKAASIANINLIRLLHEPTAAAIAYGLENKKKGIVAVYDLGGGTFDISILSLKKGIFEVLATGGDSNLGGDDFDLALAQYIYKKSKIQKKCDIFLQSRLLHIARKTKIDLSTKKIASVHFCSWNGYITRDEFNGIIECFIEKTLLICLNILKDINLKLDRVEEIIMVGGSTRIPLVYQKVLKFFQKNPLIFINPDQVVAIGAATQIDMLMKKTSDNKTILLDVTPISLGIEVMGGFVEHIISRNTTIPISKTKEFTTYQDNQTSILIHVLQGERECVKDCLSLSRFVLKGIPPKKAGTIRILVTFEIDAEGLISIQAVEQTSGLEKKIYIDQNIKLFKTNIDDTFDKSVDYKKKDYFFRITEEKKMECNGVLNILEKALQEDKHLINKKDFKKIEYEKNKLQKYINQNDFHAMKNQLNKLDEASKKLFLLRVKKSLQSVSIKNF